MVGDMSTSMMFPIRCRPARGDDRRALSGPGRADAIRLLDALREAPATVQELQQATGASQQNVSKHLGLLLRSGLVSRPRRATSRCMRLPTRACSSCVSRSVAAYAASWTSSRRCCGGATG